jgi:hypothetical protein
VTAQVRLAKYMYVIKGSPGFSIFVPGDLHTNNLGDFLAVRYTCPPSACFLFCRMQAGLLRTHPRGRWPPAPRQCGRGRRGGSQVWFQPVHRDRLRAAADVDHKHLLARPDDSIWPLVERLQRRLAGPHLDVHQLRLEELWWAVGVQLLPPQRSRG